MYGMYVCNRFTTEVYEFMYSLQTLRQVSLLVRLSLLMAHEQDKGELKLGIMIKHSKFTWQRTFESSSRMAENLLSITLVLCPACMCLLQQKKCPVNLLGLFPNNDKRTNEIARSVIIAKHFTSNNNNFFLGLSISILSGFGTECC